jgi:hypothetical protein
MTPKIKKVIFYFSLVIFVITTYIVVLYAQGYKYSFTENKFFRTGAIYLKTNVEAEVYLNDKKIGNTSFFNNSFRLEGLLPKKYNIKIQKNNYSIWEKTVTIEEGLVTEFSKIILLPKEGPDFEKLKEELNILLSEKPINTSASSPFFLKNKTLLITKEKDDNEILATDVKGFNLSFDKSKIVWWTNNEIWVMWIYNSNFQPYHKAGDKELITRYSIPIKNVVWFRDNEHLLVDTGYYNILEIDTRGGINIVTL